MTATKITPGLITTLVGATGLPASAGYEHLSTTTASGAATYVFETMETGYDYSFYGRDIIPGTDAQEGYFQLGVAGPSYSNSGYLNNSVRSTTGSLNGRQDTTHITGSQSSSGNATNERTFNGIELFDPATASSFTSWRMWGTQELSDGTHQCISGSGFFPTDVAHTCIKFIFNSGTLSGVFKAYRRPSA